MTVRDVIAALEEMAPPGLAYDWDRIGLHSGSPDQPVSKISVALTITSEVARRVRRAKADMIVSHHPLIWDALPDLRSDNARARLAVELAAAGVACYAAHTNLDVVSGGVNTVLAERIGIRAPEPLFPSPKGGYFKLVAFVPESHLAQVRDAVSRAGAGIIGNYTHCSFSAPGTGTFMPGEGSDPYSGKKFALNEEPERRFEILAPKARLTAILDALFKSHPYEEVAYDLVNLENRDPGVSLGLRGELNRPQPLAAFAEHVRGALEVSHVRVSGDLKRRVRHVAVMGGSGGGSAAQVPGDVDVFVTGDVKYHEALDARERGLAIVDAGHHGTEKWIVPALAGRLKRALPGATIIECEEPETFTVVGA